MLKKINSTKTIVYVCGHCKHLEKDTQRTIKISDIYIYSSGQQLFMMLPPCEECKGITFIQPVGKKQESIEMKHKLIELLIKKEQFLETKDTKDPEIKKKVKNNIVMLAKNIKKSCNSDKDNVTK